MRRLLIAALSAIVPLSGCAQPPQPPVAAPASEVSPTAVMQPPAEATASPVAADTGEIPAAVPPAQPVPSARPLSPAQPVLPAQPAPPKDNVSAAPSSQPPTVPSPAKAAAPSPQESVAPAPPPVAVTAPVETAAALDLAGLEQRLRDTRAIGVFTKLSLKNQVDDLLDQFRGFYQGQIKVPLTELRQRYELLLLKVLTLLQDADRQLADTIASSREAIWGILADPQKFAKI
jgi:hypothetical protein